MALEPEGVRAPQLVGDGWLNTARCLSLGELRGKLVLLDFWTYGCINCLHVLDDLRYLERKYAGRPFVVVGVHSPKFSHEQGAEPVRQAVARYGIEHPVLLDNERRTWDAYAVRAWPTLVLVDPRGYVLGRVAGEGNRDRLDAAIGHALDLLADTAPMESAPLPIRLEAESGAYALASPLLYPGKVLADAPSKRLVLADTGHHRLVVANLDGSEPTTIGSGKPGQRNGDASVAQFRSPQGLALDSVRGILYVADAGNHLLRSVDLRTLRVATLAGTGEERVHGPSTGPACDVPLNSPWDICLLGDKLYIAMAGTHSIWVYSVGEKTVTRFAGNGAEGRADGPLAQASFAQPSGLTTDGSRLYVADSESSCIREVAAGTAAEHGTVRTIAGGDLFHFGLRDGTGDEARFQHPLGIVCASDGARQRSVLYVADTYNGCIRVVDPSSGLVETLAVRANTDGTGDAQTIAPALREPGGISCANGALYVADTNAHAIRRIDLTTGECRAVTFASLCAPELCLPG